MDILAIFAFVLTVVGLLLVKPCRDWLLDQIKWVKFMWLVFWQYLSGNVLSETTCHKYKKYPLSEEYLKEAILFLEKHYKIDAHHYGRYKFPTRVLWSNDKEIINPDDLCAKPLDSSPPEPICNRFQRAYIKYMFELGPIKHEGTDYCMKAIDLSGKIPTITVGLGLYYDNLLTQYAIEWELNRLGQQSRSIADFRKNIEEQINMPLRAAAENGVETPLLDGTTRCTAITASMMVVFKRSDGYYFVLAKRSSGVGLSQDKYHVAPAGMCEVSCGEPDREWLFKYNLFRELLEELYNKEELMKRKSTLSEYIFGLEPLKLLTECFKNEKKAIITATGLCVDLLNIRPELCTLLLVHDERFSQVETIKNWESSQLLFKPLSDIDRVLENDILPFNSVPSGATCLHLGREWLRNYGLCP